MFSITVGKIHFLLSMSLETAGHIHQSHPYRLLQFRQFRKLVKQPLWHNEMHKGSLQKYKIKKYGIFNTFQKPTPPPSMEKNKKKTWSKNYFSVKVKLLNFSKIMQFSKKYLFPIDEIKNTGSGICAMANKRFCQNYQHNHRCYLKLFCNVM